MMDRWGPKHVELTYVMNKLNHWKILCILLYGIYILEYFFYVQHGGKYSNGWAWKFNYKTSNLPVFTT